MSGRPTDKADHRFDLLPPHWRVKRAKYLFSEVSDLSSNGTETLLSVTELRGVVPRESIVSGGEELSRAESLVGYKRCQEGDLVMNIMLAWKRALGVANQAGIVSPSYAVFRPQGLHSGFVHYLLRSDPYVDDFNRRSTGIVPSRNRLYPEEFGNTLILLPPFEEQCRIAAFLDHETARIDELVHEQERLNKLVVEGHEATVVHAVTQGIVQLGEPASSREFSQIRDMGEDSRFLPQHVPEATREALCNLPKGWQVVRLWNIARRKRDLGNESMELLSVFLDRGVVPYVVDGGQVHAPSLDLSAYQRVIPGDFVLNNQQAWRGSVGVSAYEGRISPAYVVLKLDDRVDARYANYLMRSRVMVHQFELSSRGVGDIQRQIFWPHLRNALVPLPPLDEQRRIVEFLDAETAHANALRVEQDKNIALLLERRSALISAAVTGQLDLRDWQPPESLAVMGVA